MNGRAKFRDGILRGGMAAAIRLLLLGAAAVSAYLLTVSLQGGHAVGCGPGSGCDEVLKSRWAYVAGLPVSAFAVLLDIVLLATTFSCGPKFSAQQRRKAWEILFPCALLVLGAALWFVGLQVVAVGKICPWCMTAHGCGAVAAVLLLARVPLREESGRPERRDNDPALTRPAAIKLGALSLLLLALFAGAQITIAPKTYSVRNISIAATNVVIATNVAAATSPDLPSARPAPVRPLFDVYNGAVKLDLGQAPVWGSPDAPEKLVSLFDYTCHHCAEMHERVVAVQHAFSNAVAVISLPMPLDSRCNPAIRRTPSQQTNGCIYARLGLAVWRARREALIPYDDWYFADYNRTRRPPGLAEATNHAAQLVGGLAALEAASRDPWIEQQLAADMMIFSISMQQYRNGSLPQFIIGSNLVSGILETTKLEELVGKYVKQ